MLKKSFKSLEGSFKNEGELQKALTTIIAKSYPFLKSQRGLRFGTPHLRPDTTMQSHALIKEQHLVKVMGVTSTCSNVDIGVR